MVHEWALAEAIVEYVAQLSPGAGSVVEELELRLGALQSIDREVLDFALHELFREKGLVVEKITYSEVEPKLHCRRCGFEWSIDLNSVSETVREAVHFVPEAVHSFFTCPRCGSRDFEVVGGRGVEIGIVKWRSRS